MRRARLEPQTYRSGVWGVNHSATHACTMPFLLVYLSHTNVWLQCIHKALAKNLYMYVPSSPSLRSWVLVWPRTQTQDSLSTLQSSTLLTAALSNPYLWGIHLNLICVSKTLKWSSLNKILILNYLLSFLWNAYSTNPSKQYLFLKMTPKGSVMFLRLKIASLRAGSLVFPTDVFLSLSLKCEHFCHISLDFVIIKWPIIACRF